MACGRAGVYVGAVAVEPAISRRLDETAVAAQCTSPGRDGAVGPCRVIRPDYHRPASADFSGIGLEAGIRPEVGDAGVLYFRILALVVAADLDAAATRIGLTHAAGIDFGVVHDRNTIAEHFDAAAPGAGSDDAAVAIDVGVLAGLEEDAAAFADDTAGIDRTAVPDDDASDADTAGFGREGAEVGGIACHPGDIDLDAGSGAVDQADGSAGGQDGFTPGRGDDAFVADVAADEIDAATGRGADFALVDDVLGTVVIDEYVAPGKEIFVPDVERAGDEASDVDPATGADHDAGGVHQPNTAVGAQSAVDGGRVVEDTVQHRAGGGRLGEMGGFAGRDGELVPVDDGAVAVGHRQDLAGLVEAGHPIDHVGIYRQGQDRGTDEARSDGDDAEANRRGQPGGVLAERIVVAHIRTPRAGQTGTRMYFVYSAKNDHLPCSKSHLA